jgi:hypothetical protein
LSSHVYIISVLQSKEVFSVLLATESQTPLFLQRGDTGSPPSI